MPTRAKPTASLKKSDYELIAQFRYTVRKFLGFSEAAAVAHGVAPQQYQALLAIEGFPGRNWVTIGELAEQMQVAHHSAVGLVDRMEALKLVRRAGSQEDRRRVHVSLSAKGRSVLEKLYRVHRTELQQVAPTLVSLLQQVRPPQSSKTRPAPRSKPMGEFSSPACSMTEIDD